MPILFVGTLFGQWTEPVELEPALVFDSQIGLGQDSSCQPYPTNKRQGFWTDLNKELEHWSVWWLVCYSSICYCC